LLRLYKLGTGFRVWAGVLAALTCLSPRAQAQGSVSVEADLLKRAAAASVQNASIIEVKGATPAGGVLQQALFEHPKGVGKPARVSFALRLPVLARGERLLFAFDVALSDGVPWAAADPKPDGVGFSVQVNGKTAYSQTWRQSAWHPGAVDLTARSGQRVELSLLVDALTSANYDWALWGRPRLLRVTAAPVSAGRGQAFTDTTVGVLLADDARPLRRLRLIPDSGAPIEWNRDDEGQSRALVAFEYRFPGARRVRIESQPADSRVRLATAAAPPSLRIETVSCVRALPLVGERTVLRVAVRNAGPGVLAAGRAATRLSVGGVALSPKQIPRLAPGQVWRAEWPWRGKKTGPVALLAAVTTPGAPAAARKTGSVEAFLPPRATDILDSPHLRLQFVRGRGGYAGAIVRARREGQWVAVGSLAPLFRVAPTAAALWEPRPKVLRRSVGKGREAPAGSLTTMQRGPDGVLWKCDLTIALDPAAPTARLRYAWRPSRATTVRALLGPNLYVGDGTVGEASSGGLFPGLEFLSPGEASSSSRGFAPPLGERSTPNADKITIPLMAVAVGPDSIAPPLNPDRFYCPDSLSGLRSPRRGSTGAPSASAALTVALLWDGTVPGAASRAARPRPSPRFSSPNTAEGMSNHRLGLFLPSCPEFVGENTDRSRKPYALAAGQDVTLAATIAVTAGPPLTAVRSWLRENGGVPAPSRLPRSPEAAFALSRDALRETVWNPQTGMWRSSVETPEEPIPGIASLLYLDSRTAADPETARRSQAQMEEGVAAMIARGGPGSLSSRSSSHILRWELPFFYGYLPASMDALEKEIRQIQSAQQPDGGWRFRAGDPQRASLGKAGDAVCGLASHHAWMLMRYARITGDTAALAAGERALRWIAQFRVPRGASVWECPIYEPDILAADWNLAACLEGYQATGNRRWLHDAVYWAETGLPFIYLWSRPDRPAMLGASIATFGTTFYTHTWLETPVQWEGLIYGYNLLHLADALQKAGAGKTGSPLPLSVNMTPREWRRVADLVFVSGLHQQVADGPKKGTYPDSITDFVRPNPVFINPENLMVHLLTRQGHDPDIKTVVVLTAGGSLRISSEARVTAEGAGKPATEVRLRVGYFAGSSSHLLIVGPAPREVRIDGKALARLPTPIEKDTGWSRDDRKNTTYLSVPHAAAQATIDLRF
jgi:hypothetical protein